MQLADTRTPSQKLTAQPLTALAVSVVALHLHQGDAHETLSPAFFPLALFPPPSLLPPPRLHLRRQRGQHHAPHPLVCLPASLSLRHTHTCLSSFRGCITPLFRRPSFLLWKSACLHLSERGTINTRFAVCSHLVSKHHLHATGGLAKRILPHLFFPS